MSGPAPMQVAFGLKAHSGWAALVVLGRRAANGSRRDAADTCDLVDRRRLDLLALEEMAWAKQPYHAAEELTAAEARRLVERASRAVQRGARRALLDAAGRAREAGHTIAACAVLAGAPMPHWSVEEIRSVHLRMHQAEGALFRDALGSAAAECGLAVVAVPEKSLMDRARAALGARHAKVMRALAAIGREAGPPWGKDQKEAALAAVLAWDAVLSRSGRAPMRSGRPGATPREFRSSAEEET